MLNSKFALFFRRCLSIKKPSYGYKWFNFLSNNPVIIDDDIVVFEGNAGSRIAILNRPVSLNAINTDMVVRLQKVYNYKDWEDDHDV
ncbi:hypothetical protein ACS0TY_003666 [Phlomoides rotata]